jgi:putative hydroxymethylpyrimidine transport system substrate-binding protein
VLLAIGAVLTGCGEKQEQFGTATDPPRETTLALDWNPNPNQAPVYVAREDGAYIERRIDLRLKPPTDPAEPIRQVADGDVDLAISYEPEVLLARERGLKVVAIGALIQQPLSSLVWLEGSGIRSVRDLEGKRIGIPGIAFMEEMLGTILERHGVDPDTVKTVDLGRDLVDPLSKRKVDAVFGMFWNIGGLQLKLAGKKPVIKPANELGVPDYDELVFVAHENRLKTDPGPVRGFLAGTARGARLTQNDPRLGTRVLRQANPNLNLALVEASLRETIPLYFPKQPGRPFGFLDPVQWQEFGAWMEKNGMLKRKPDISMAITNEHLVGGRSEG